MPDVTKVDVTQLKTPGGSTVNLLTLRETAIAWTDGPDGQFKWDIIPPPGGTIDLDILGGIIDTLVAVGGALKQIFGGCQLVPDTTVTFGPDGKVSKIETTMKCAAPA
jgi:hypothetical protein